MIADQPCIIEHVEEQPSMTLLHAVERPTLMLYYYPECPYCRKVLHALEQMNKTVPMRNIRTNPKACDELVRIGGKAIVPCLVINGKAMYESKAIIKWLQDNRDLY